MIIFIVYILIGASIAVYSSLGLENNTIYDILLNVVSFIGIILLWPWVLLAVLFYK